MAGYDFYQNSECEYFPCHSCGQEDFNCLFCYCPLYALGENCGGNFTYTDKGIKDCSACTFPHRRENYPKVVEKMEGIIALAKQKES